MLLSSHGRAVSLYGEVPAILKYSVVCPLFFSEAEGPGVSLMAGRKQAPQTPAQLQFWQSKGEALSESELTLYQNPFKTSWVQGDATFRAAALDEVLLLDCTLHFV